MQCDLGDQVVVYLVSQCEYVDLQWLQAKLDDRFWGLQGEAIGALIVDRRDLTRFHAVFAKSMQVFSLQQDATLGPRTLGTLP